MSSNSGATYPANLGGLPPPSGVTPNFSNPYSIAPTLKAINIVCATLTSIATLVRIFTRLYIMRSHGWPDYTMVVAWAGYISYLFAGYSIYNHGAGIHQWNVPIDDLVPFVKASTNALLIYCPTIVLAKLSISLQFVNIFTPERDAKFWMIQGFIFVQASFYLSLFFVTLFECVPRAKIWNPTLPGTCVKYQGTILATGIFNMVSDLLMLVFPFFCIWNLQMPIKRKGGVSAIFLVGILALAASMLRVIYTAINNGNPDATFTLTQIGECSAGELAAGILIGNLVCLPRLFKQYGPKVKRLLSKYSRSNLGSERPREKGSFARPRHGPKPSSWLQSQMLESQSAEYLELKDRPFGAAVFPDSSLQERQSSVSDTLSGRPRRQIFSEPLVEAQDEEGVLRTVHVEQSVEHV